MYELFVFLLGQCIHKQDDRVWVLQFFFLMVSLSWKRNLTCIRSPSLIKEQCAILTITPQLVLCFPEEIKLGSSFFPRFTLPPSPPSLIAFFTLQALFTTTCTLVPFPTFPIPTKKNRITQPHIKFQAIENEEKATWLDWQEGSRANGQSKVQRGELIYGRREQSQVSQGPAHGS
jgi:hypothetical protein